MLSTASTKAANDSVITYQKGFAAALYRLRGEALRGRRRVVWLVVAEIARGSLRNV